MATLAIVPKHRQLTATRKVTAANAILETRAGDGGQRERRELVERFIQTIGQECLDHFLVLGKRNLTYLVAEFLEHDHLECSHQAAA